MQQSNRAILFLAGLRGTGKSVVGKLVAKILGIRHVDLDEAISETAGKSIAEIFSDGGERSFRFLESTELIHVCQNGPSVVSLGGGACVEPQNRKVIRAAGKTVWLTGSPEILLQRIEGDSKSESDRPPLTDLFAMEEIQLLQAARHDGYKECADLVLDTDTSKPDELAQRICQWWNDSR